MNLKDFLVSSSRLTKKLLALACDFTSIYLAILYALFVSDNLNYTNVIDMLVLLWIPFVGVLIFWYAGVYRSIVRYIDFSVIFLLLQAISLTLLINFVALNIYSYLSITFNFQSNDFLFDLEIWLAGFMASTFFVIGSRLIANYYLSERISEKRVVIYGAGSAGIQLASALRVSSEMQPVAFIDRDPSLHNTFLGGIKVLHPKKLERMVNRNKVDEVLIAIPSASRSILKELLKEIEEYTVKVRILPGLAELAQGKVLVSELKEVDITDLLGRYEVAPNQELLDRNIKNKTVLITGAGGSIGSEIARQVARNNPKNLILLDANEFALYEIKNEIDSLRFNTNTRTIIASVTNKRRMTEVYQTFKVDTIYHSAAYKHVPLVEENPFEGIYNNIIGTKICLEAAIDSKVATFVLISTDKAVRPTNIMGATKRFAEMILQSYSDEKNINNVTRMTMVRFGNVLGSSGSAIPLFQKQIREGGPVTVTNPDVTRYFMSIPEAAELVIQAGAMGEGGDVFVLDMGEPVKIIELAKRLINLSGYEVKDGNNPNGDIEIIFTGLRPGEKLYEELLIGDNVSRTDHKQILRAEEEFITKEEIERFIDELGEAEKGNDVHALKEIFKQVIHGYESEQDIVDVLSLHNLRNQTT
jgi:FlaA1/EpsC-like NDP-sugar epimerase